MILLAGVMNFINLYLVLMVKRGKVYSLRKVFGADRKALFKQIFIENFLLIAASMIVAWLIVEVTNIPVSSMFGSQLMYTAFDGILSFSILLFLLCFRYCFSILYITCGLLHLFCICIVSLKCR